MNPISKMGIGPMSSEIIEAVFRFSELHTVPLMLIASKNQIDWDYGYVNRWDTTAYGSYLNTLRHKYPRAQVFVCRDHCGPGFKNDDLADVYKTIDADLANGFQLVHVDFCHYRGPREEMLAQAATAIQYVLSHAPNTYIEIGTDENTGALLEDEHRIEQEMQYFTSKFPVHFFVVQTGSLVKEHQQEGIFNTNFITRVRPIADHYKLCLKEHNADYLSQEEIQKRRGLVDAVNVAPQFGVIQTMLTLTKCLLYGIDILPFAEVVHAGKKWHKWLSKNTAENRALCTYIAGHYHFASDEYARIYEAISKHENFRETLITEMMKHFSMYLNAL